MSNPNGRQPVRFKWKNEEYGLNDLAKKLGVKPRTFFHRYQKHGLDAAIKISLMSEAEYKDFISKVNSKEYRETKVLDIGEDTESPVWAQKTEVIIPANDPDYELRNRAKNLIERFGFEGAMAKASLRI